MGVVVNIIKDIDNGFGKSLGNAKTTLWKNSMIQ